jgi:hypothetical protein
MTGLVVVALGVWTVLSGLILLVICMNSSRLSRMQGPFRRYPSRIIIPSKKQLSDLQSNRTPVNVE